MLLNQPNTKNRSPLAERPFPWLCRHCGKQEVSLSTIEYRAQVRHDGQLHEFTITDLELPVCQACGKRLFTHHVDVQVNDALRLHLNLLTPSQIHDGVVRVGLTQEELASHIGIAEDTLTSWLNETQIQSRAMDNLLRTFFAFPQVRAALGSSPSVNFGLADATASE